MCCAPKCGPPACWPPMCCCPRPTACRPPLEPLRPANGHQCCPASKCKLCSQKHGEKGCRCTCPRNKHILEALSCLFRVSKFQVLTTLFQLAFHESQPLPRFPRDREWSVMENVKAPYSELHDLKIYDSLYDRCGQPIDPLDRSNAYKLLRLIFLGPVLVPEQRSQLLVMLRRLNARAACPVDLDGLLIALQEVQLDELVCGILEQDGRVKRFHSARRCQELCSLYHKVAAMDKKAVAPERRRQKAKPKGKDADAQKKPQRRTITQQIYCTRRTPEVVEEPSNRAEGSTPIIRSTGSSLRRSDNNKKGVDVVQRSSATASEKGSSRGSRNSQGSPKRGKPEAAPSLGVRMQGGDRVKNPRSSQ
ncbi:uncharacterized protein LOC108095535 [Drosophila ficusphila]|uniref:uncharacterized protein LOC108095535 n=1 Tax=Drosophila ficusphila TaxID=30025 RepID=UPI0007E6F4DB|nr:uncharacterized protein LOC108095535 [Drosophila ficusphila]